MHADFPHTAYQMVFRSWHAPSPDTESCRAGEGPKGFEEGASPHCRSTSGQTRPRALAQVRPKDIKLSHTRSRTCRRGDMRDAEVEAVVEQAVQKSRTRS